MSRFSYGDDSPVSRIWVIYAALGAMGTGLLSIPSYGPPIALVPLFLAAGVLSAVGAWRLFRRVAIAGLCVLSIAAWARSLAVLGVETKGALSPALAFAVWWWLAVGALMLAVEVSRRGLR